MCAISSMQVYSVSSRRSQRLKNMQLDAVSLLTEKPAFAERLAGPWFIALAAQVLKQASAQKTHSNHKQPLSTLRFWKRCEASTKSASAKILRNFCNGDIHKEVPWKLVLMISVFSQPVSTTGRTWECNLRMRMKDFDTEKEVCISSFHDIMQAALIVTWWMMMALHLVPSMLWPTKIRYLNKRADSAIRIGSKNGLGKGNTEP